MTDIIIRAENLGKKYLIGHQAQNGSYTALRDVLMHNARSLWHKTRDLVQGKPTVQGDTLEEVWVLKEVSFDIRRGEMVGIIGRNGAGKSTLLKILSQITEPTEGRVCLRGRVASLLEVGTGFHPELTGRENIFLNGAILGMSRAEIRKKFDEMVAFAEVEKFIDTPVKRYSSGMYVRLAFAVAAHLEPEILVVDEVLAVGDAAFQKKCLGKMGDVAKEGRTVLFVSHNMAAIGHLCNRGILLSQGQITCSGDISMVIDRYLQGLTPVQTMNAPYIAKNNELAITLRSFNFLNQEGETIPIMHAGSPIVLRLRLETCLHRKDLLVSMSVNTLQDLRVCAMHTVISGFTLELNPPGADIHCKLPNVPFSPGRYRLSIKIVVDGIVAFYLPNIIEVDVEAGDFYGTGRIPDNSWGGVCLVEHSWDTAPIVIEPEAF
jgi:homopolymeric O-antigen transport system ATP-binding protein